MAEPIEPKIEQLDLTRPFDEETVDEYVKAKSADADAANEKLDIDGLLETLVEGRTKAMVSPEIAVDQTRRLSEGKHAIVPESIPGALDFHAQGLGMTVDEYRQRASDLGISIEFFEDTVGRRGLSIEEAKKMAAERGVTALMPAGQRKVQLRGLTNQELGIERLKAQGKPIPEELITPTGRDFYLSGSQAGFYGSGPGIFSDKDPLEELSKRGEFGYRVAANIVDELSKDRTLVASRELYENKELGWADYVEDQVNRALKTLPDPPSSKSEEAYAKWQARKVKLANETQLRALKQIALWKTVNLWTAPIFVPYEIDEAGRVRIPRPDDMTLKQALMPTLEIIGTKYNAKTGVTETVVRQAGATQHVFDMMDLLQSGGTGVLAHITDPEQRPEGEGVGDAFVRGIANRRNLFEYALSTKMAEESLPGAITAGGLGFLGAVLAPDVFVGFGAKQIAKHGMKVAAYAKHASKTAPLLKEIALARADWANAAREMVERGGVVSAEDFRRFDELGSRVNQLESELQGKYAEVMDAVDIRDAEVAQRLERENPQIGMDGSSRLDDNLPEEVSHARYAAHPSYRKNLAAADEGGERLGRKERYETDKIARKLLEARNRLLDETGATDDMADQLGLWFTKPRKLQDGRVIPGLAEIEPEELFVWANKNLKQAIDDPKAFRDAMDDKIRELLPGAAKDADGAQTAVGGRRQLLHILSSEIASKGKSMRVVDPSGPVDLNDVIVRLEALDDAIEALAVNAESRALGAVLTREQILSKINPFSAQKPILPELRESVEEIPILTSAAIQFADALVDVVGIDRTTANMLARVNDVRAHQWHLETGRAPSEWWRSRIDEVRRRTEPETPETPPTPGAPHRPEAPPTPKPQPPEAQKIIDDIGEPVKVEPAPPEAVVKLTTYSWPGVPRQKDPGIGPGSHRPMPKRQGNELGFPEEVKPGLPAQELFDHLRHEKSALKVVEFLRDHGKLAATRLLCRRIEPLLRKNDALFNIKTAQRQGAKPTNLGEYNTNTQVITIAGPGYTQTGLTEETLVHELLHAATSLFVGANPGSDAVTSLAKLRDEVVAVIRQTRTDLVAAGIPETKIQRLIEEVTQEGTAGVEEFLAYGMTDSTFQAILRGIKLKDEPEGLFNKFTDLLAKILGATGKSAKSALTRAIRLSDEVIEAAGAGQAEKIVREAVTPKAGETVTKAGVLGFDKSRIIQLLGPIMYDGNLVDVCVKEVLQNSFDAVRDAEKIGVLKAGAGRIEIKLLNGERVVEIKDNGIGMTPEIVDDAFLTVGGTQKEGVAEGRAAGGLGLAKMAFLFGPNDIELVTFRDGVKTTLKATREQLMTEDFTILTSRAPKGKHGTTLRMVIPKYVRDAYGEEKYIWFNENPGFLTKPLLGDVTVTLQRAPDKMLQKAPSEVLKLGKNIDLSDYKQLTSATFGWGTADIYLGTRRVKNPVHAVLSAGLYQFDDHLVLFEFEKIPYNIIIDVKPKVPAEKANYPFNNQREGYRSTVKPDILAMSAYIARYFRGKEAQATADQFSSATNMVRLDLGDLGANLGEIRKRHFVPRATKLKPDRPKPVHPVEIEIIDGEVKVDGRTVMDRRDVKNATKSEQEVPETFKPGEEVVGPEAFFGAQKVDEKTPLFLNNTDMDPIAVAEAAGFSRLETERFFASMGSIVLDFKERAAKMSVMLASLNDAKSPYAAGISIDKVYKGVHVLVPYKAFFLNPLAFTEAKTVNGATAAMYLVMVHEAAHVVVGGHDKVFAQWLHKVSDEFADVVDGELIKTALEETLSRHWDLFDVLRKHYDRSDVRNIAKSMEGAEVARVPREIEGELGGRVADRARAAGTGRGERFGAGGGPGRAERGAGDIAAEADTPARDVILGKIDEAQRGGVPVKPRTLAHRADADGAVTGASAEFLNDGSAIIHAMTNADASSVVYAMGRILRRDLRPDDLGVVVRWLRSQSSDFAQLSHEANRFTGVSDDLVERAEDLFSRGFEKYLREGVSPASTDLHIIFEKLKQALLHIYRAVRPDVELTEEVRGVFDRLFHKDAGPRKEMLPTVAKVLRDEIIGPPAEREVSVFAEIAKEATRLGIKGKTARGLKKEFETPHYGADGKRLPGQIILEDPIMHERKIGTITDEGEHVLTVNDILKLQTELEEERMIVAGMRDPRIGDPARSRALDEDSATEAIRTVLQPGGAWYNDISRFAAGLMFGGDAYWDIRKFPPTTRRSIEAAMRPIQEAIGDAISLGVEGRGTPAGFKKIAQYLGGDTINFREGRPVLSSGEDFVGDTSTIINRMWNGLSEDEQAHLQWIAYIVNRRKGPLKTDLLKLKLSTSYREGDASFDSLTEMWNTVDSIFSQQKSVLMHDLAHAVGLQTFQDHKKNPDFSLRLIETILYHAGVTKRAEGRIGDLTSFDIASGILRDIQSITDRKDNVLHVAAVIAGNGAAERARQTMVGMGLAITEKENKAWNAWLSGGAVDAADRAALREISERIGVNAGFFKAAEEMFEGFYVPEALKTRMMNALARYMIKPPTKGAAVIGENNLHAGFSVFYTFMKTRMTRGAFFLRQRYFLMNTFDHFTQMAIRTGFGPALVSTVRVMAQNGMILPGVSRGLYLMRKGRKGVSPLPPGKLAEDVSEEVRKKLQQGGDAAAQKVGKWLALTKYNINVNPILEGSDELIQVGNKLHRARDIRKVATEEGIFASFDTRALERIIRQERTSQFKNIATNNPSAYRRVADALDDFLKNTKDTAEAWSERERLGAMVTLMEMGYSPRVAARVTIDALYDYAGSMADVDRVFLLNMVLPFWAFQKNANKQVFDALFSPWGAYRLNVLRRGQEYGMDLISHVLYESTVDPYGVDLGNLPDELKANYWALRNSIEFGFGNGQSLENIEVGLRNILENEFGPLDELDEETRDMLENGYGGPENVPHEVKRAIRMIFQSRPELLAEGRMYTLNAALVEGMRQANKLGGDSRPIGEIADYTIPARDKAGRPSHRRDVPGAMITLPRTHAVRKWTNLVERVAPNHTYHEAFIPESTIHAGMNHLAYTMALGINGIGIFDALGEDQLDPRITKITPRVNILEEIFPYERAPLMGPAMHAFGIIEAPPTRIHPDIGEHLESIFGVDPGVLVPGLLVKYEGKDLIRGAEDPYAEEWQAEMGYSDEEMARLTKAIPDRYYLSPGLWSVAFNNAPVGLVEVNQLLFDLDARPGEAAHIRGKILHWGGKVFLGMDITEIQRDTQARREQPRRKTTTTEPPR